MAQFEDEDDCFKENIVAEDGKDRRQKISISPSKSNDIIQCIGSVWVGYQVEEQTQHRMGTATVIAIGNNNQCIALTAAHNLDTLAVRECLLCHTKMISLHCYCSTYPTKTKLTDQKVSPFRVQFQRRCIHESMSIDNIHYTLGQIIQSYEVNLADCKIRNELYRAHPLVNRGYDICLLSFDCDDENGINLYNSKCARIRFITDTSFSNNKCKLHIFGYPHSGQIIMENGKRKPNYYTMYGMSTGANNSFRVRRNTKTNKYYIINTDIDTSAGQSGSVIWTSFKDQKNVKLYVIYGIHTGGASRSKKNYGTFLDDDTLNWMDSVCCQNDMNIKTSLVKIKMADIAILKRWCRVDCGVNAITTANPVNMHVWRPSSMICKRRYRYSAHVGIHFGADGTSFCYALPTGKILWQQNHTRNADIKDRTNILLESKPPYNLIAFGSRATLQYTESHDKKSLYFADFTMLFNGALVDNDVYYDNDEKSQHNPVVYLTASNGKQLDSQIVFARAMGEIKRIAMKTLNRSAEITRVMDVQWILAVPTIWPEFAKELLRKAAVQAGINKKGSLDHFLIITEPQCVSITARKHIKDLNKINTKYIMLELNNYDIVDITCQKTTASEYHPSKQIYASKRGQWGSLNIDKEYEKLLIDIFSQEIIEKFKIAKPNKWIDIQEKFRKSKYHYDGRDRMNIDLNSSLLHYIENYHENDDIEEIVDEYKYKGQTGLIECDEGTLTLFKSVWDDLFKCVIDPIIKETSNLLKQRGMEDCKDILLTGTFSENKYLTKTVKTCFSQYRVHHVPRSYVAVVEGAALSGLRPNTWFASESVGLQITRDYEAKIDHENMKRYDNESKQYVIDCGFGTLIENGEAIEVGKCKVKWFKPWKLSKQTEIKIKVYSTDNKNAKHTSNSAKGEYVKKLPANWGNKPFPILYYDNGIEKRLFFAHPEWNGDREIKIYCSNPMDNYNVTAVVSV